MARYHEIADVLRARIADGTLPVGEAVPSADRIAHEQDTGRDTALKALRLLRREGLLFLGRDNVVRVGPAQRRAANGPDSSLDLVDLPAHAVLRSRMPTPREREELSLPEGVPVLVVRLGEDEEVHPATGTGMRWPLDQGS